MTKNIQSEMKEILEHFSNYKISHSKLTTVLKEAMFYLLKSQSTALVTIVGPTGVGKTALMDEIEKEVIKASSEKMALNPDMLPYIRNLALADGHRRFSQKVFYTEALQQLDDPFWRLPPRRKAVASASGTLAGYSRGRTTTAELRLRLEREMTWRMTSVWAVDEAQHVVFGGTSGAPEFQLDMFKSISQRTSTKLLLLGPPQLEAQLLSSGQLARRSRTIHFCRYQNWNNEDMLEYASVAAMFFKAMRIKSTPAVAENIDLIYSGGFGCVGILRDWLLRALELAVEDSSDVRAVELTRDHLIRTRMDARQLKRISQEIENMEATMKLEKSEASENDIFLGELGSDVANRFAANAKAQPSTGRSPKRVGETPGPSITTGSEAPAKRKCRPGVRKPGRDKVGGSEIWGE